jgi:hypothetical protein
MAALALLVLPTATASAGRLLVTGHDADLHCSSGSQCHFVEVATSYVRDGAPDPSKPVLVLDRQNLDFIVALNNAFGEGVVPTVVMDPRSPQFASAPLTTDRYSAILIASDYTCGGCDLNIPEGGEGASETPDSDAINARSDDIAAFFNAGGGIYANSGASHGDGNEPTDVYYDFVPLPLGGLPVRGPFCLTSVGASLGFEDQSCPDAARRRGTNNDINCCATHNSFEQPDPTTALEVAEIDVAGDGVVSSDDVPETLVAEGEIRGGEIVEPQPPADTTDTTAPDTPITSGPPAFGTDNTATFTFSSSHTGSTFECSLDGGPFVPCTSPFTTPDLPPGEHTFAVRAISVAGIPDPTPTVYEWTIAADLSDLSRPVLGEEFNLGPVPGSGPVFYAVPAQGAGARGSASASQKGLRFRPLKQARQIPVGSFLKTRQGTVQLVTATGSGNETQSGKFNGGMFQVLQSRARRARGLTELRLKGSSFDRCRTEDSGKSADAAQVRRRSIRRLRSNTRGRFSARGRYSAGTTRGTVWVTADRCDGTLTSVKRGKVAVRDFRRKKTIVVGAGKRYLAKAPG